MMEIGSIIEISLEELLRGRESDEICLPFMKSDSWYIDFFNIGRAAIQAYIGGMSVKRIWVPSFICSSVTEAITRTGKKIEYYPVTRKLQINLNFFEGRNIGEDDCFYLMQYFSVSISEETRKFLNHIKTQGAVIFEDITMSLFSDASEHIAVGDYVIGSIRKWCAIPDGAFIASRCRGNILNIEKAQAGYDYTLYYFAAQIMKSLYLTNTEKYDKNIFLDYVHQGVESLFEDYTIREISSISNDLLRKKWADRPKT